MGIWWARWCLYLYGNITGLCTNSLDTSMCLKKALFTDLHKFVYAFCEGKNDDKPVESGKRTADRELRRPTSFWLSCWGKVFQHLRTAGDRQDKKIERDRHSWAHTRDIFLYLDLHYIYIYVYVYIYVYIYVYMYICIYVCIYIYIYVCMYIYIYIFIYTYDIFIDGIYYIHLYTVNSPFPNAYNVNQKGRVVSAV